MLPKNYLHEKFYTFPKKVLFDKLNASIYKERCIAHPQNKYIYIPF